MSSEELTRIRFEDSLIEAVLSGEKDTTWRIWSGKDKNVEVNESVSLQDTDGEEFGKAKVLWVKDTAFGRLTDEDREGHETFESEEEMLQTYSNYYNREVSLNTKLKIIKFKTVEK